MLTFRQFLNEHILNIGLNPDHDHYRELYRDQIHDILHHSYKKIGGYGGVTSGSKEESDAIHHDITHSGIIKATKRGDKITNVRLYKNQHGRKMIAAGTDGSEQGHKDFYKSSDEDNKQKRAWGEVSGALSHIHQKIGYPKVPAKNAENLLGKKVNVTGKYTYSRPIGGHEHEKMIMGHPQI